MMMRQYNGGVIILLYKVNGECLGDTDLKDTLKQVLLKL